eukprot:2987217-Lingulodinium_polyedra.AAC.1
MEQVLALPGQWVFYNKSEQVKKALKKVTPHVRKNLTVVVVFYAMLVLEVLGLGRVFATGYVVGGGRSNFCFVKATVT